MCVCVSVFRGLCCVDAYDTDSSFLNFLLKVRVLFCNLVKVDPTQKDAVEILMSQYLHVLAHSQPEKEEDKNSAQ